MYDQMKPWLASCNSELHHDWHYTIKQYYHSRIKWPLFFSMSRLTAKAAILFCYGSILNYAQGCLTATSATGANSLSILFWLVTSPCLYAICNSDWRVPCSVVMWGGVGDVWYSVMWCVASLLCVIVMNSIINCDVMWCNVMWYHVMSCIVICRVVSCQLVSSNSIGWWDVLCTCLRMLSIFPLSYVIVAFTASNSLLSANIFCFFMASNLSSSSLKVSFWVPE